MSQFDPIESAFEPWELSPADLECLEEDAPEPLTGSELRQMNPVSGADL